MSPADVEAISRRLAASTSKEWGLAPGLPREAKLRTLYARMLSDPTSIEAMKKKPFSLTHEQWGNQLNMEGYPLLPDETLKRYAAALSRNLNEATDAECASYVQARSGMPSEADVNAWRQRLARVPEEDFDTITQTELEAFRARASRLSEPAYAFTPTQKQFAKRAFESQILPDEYGLIAAILSKDQSAITALESCNVVRTISKVQARASGTDAGLLLRILMVPGFWD